MTVEDTLLTVCRPCLEAWLKAEGKSVIRKWSAYERFPEDEAYCCICEEETDSEFVLYGKRFA